MKHVERSSIVQDTEITVIGHAGHVAVFVLLVLEVNDHLETGELVQHRHVGDAVGDPGLLESGTGDTRCGVVDVVGGSGLGEL